MTKLLFALLAFGQIATVKPTVVNPSEWSYYDVVRAPDCVKIDGVLAEKEWGKVPAISTFSECFQADYPPVHPTTARLMWDDKYLYVAFECTDNDIWGTYTKFDDPVYSEEAVEVFIDPEGQGRHYFEIDMSPRNVVVDLMIIKAGWQARAETAKRYNVEGLLTGAKVYGTLDDREDRDEKWTAEMAIPWSDFAGRKVNVPPRIGDSWRLNLFRIDRLGPDAEDDQFMSWSKSPGVFHQPKNFGVVTFRR